MTQPRIFALRLLMASAAFTVLAACSPAAETPADPDGHSAGGHGVGGHGGAGPAAEAAIPAVAPGGSAVLGSLSITSARLNPPPGGREVSAAYLTIANGGGETDRLVSVSSPGAGIVELHTHTHDGGMMKMEQVAAIDVPAGARVTLEPGGLHLMLFEVKPEALEAGTFPMTLTFERGGPVEVAFTVIEP